MKTSKLYLAAALISLGAGLEKIDRTDPKHMEFYLFYASPIMPEDEWFTKQLDAWRNKSLMVNAQAYVDAVQELKAEVHKSS